MISETLIDNIYTNIKNDSMKAGIIYWDISDHYPIFTCFKNCLLVKKRKNYNNKIIKPWLIYHKSI